MNSFEDPKIANKTHSEILSLSHSSRGRWYKTLTAEEKIEALSVILTKRRLKMSVAMYGRKHSVETRAKISKAAKKQWEDPKHRAKISEIAKKRWANPEFKTKMSGENHPSKRPEVRAKLRATMNQPEVRAKISAALSGANNPMRRPEVRTKHNAAVNQLEYRTKMSAALSGENNPRWKGGASFEPYCPKFNFELKERIRNAYNRTCLRCRKLEIFNGGRLSVHHIDGDKMQGCNGKRWALVPLCKACHLQLHGATGHDAIELEFLLATRAEEYRRR